MKGFEKEIWLESLDSSLAGVFQIEIVLPPISSLS